MNGWNPWLIVGGALTVYFLFLRPKNVATAAAKIEQDVAKEGMQMPPMTSIDKIDMSALTDAQLAEAKSYMHDYYRRVGSWPTWQQAFASIYIKTPEGGLIEQTWSAAPGERVGTDDPGWTPQGRM
jgi:hypothetical protein